MSEAEPVQRARRDRGQEIRSHRYSLDTTELFLHRFSGVSTVEARL